MKTGPQMNTLLQSLQAKVENQASVAEAQTQKLLKDFELHLSQALHDAQKKIARDMHVLEELSTQVHDRTAGQIMGHAQTIQQAVDALEASRREWRTVTWKTMLPYYLGGVLLTCWVLMMAVQLTFPAQERATALPNLATFGLEGTSLIHGPGGLGRVVRLPRGVEVTRCPIPNIGGGSVCIDTVVTR
ncbi:hypothetical protein [Paracoccus sp. (in: a-proteobacteria)]|uniref:hypothetical protein n=1 Tax=Paracoccus sp. TaxID=267 RepID=UPI002AFDF3EB|nr:hypothetical protein [Paracoccus sp. (in: a-proteobacteria)]